MMLVRTYLAPSPIAGIGCFAAERIAVDAPVWRFNRKIDIILSEVEVAMLPLIGREFFLSHGYRDSETGEYVLCGDFAKFFNHSDTPNTYVLDDPTCRLRMDAAARDIEPGEEITTNYHHFDSDTVAKLAAAST